MTMLNTEIRDPFTKLQAGWDLFATTWTSTGTAPAVGNGLLQGSYYQVGNTVMFRIGLLFGSTTTLGTGTYFFGLPTTLVPLYSNVGESMSGSCIVRDTSLPAQRGFTPYYASAANNRVACMQQDGTLLSATTPFTWAVGDRISLAGQYEIP